LAEGACGFFVFTEATPADIAGKEGFFGIGRVAVFRLKLFERADGREIVVRLLMEAALSDTVSGGDAKVAGGSFFDCRFGVKGDEG
jgi:hypothetical protein